VTAFGTPRNGAPMLKSNPYFDQTERTKKKKKKAHFSPIFDQMQNNTIYTINAIYP
jgi:hypothetical protein